MVLCLNRDRHMTALDKRLVGEQNTLAILTHLHRFGWLTSRMLAALVWPAAKQSQAMARRTLKTLTDQKLVIKRALAEGGDCYVLSASGARWLSEQAGITAKAGSALKLGNAVHRACSNWYLITRLLAGDVVWTEYEIQSGRAPLVTVAGKTPDGLVETPFGLVWVEVENAWKNRTERGKVVSFCRQCLLPGSEMAELAPNAYLFRVAIVSATGEALRSMAQSLADAHASSNLSDTQAGDIELALLPVDKSLVAGSLQQCLLSDFL